MLEILALFWLAGVNGRKAQSRGRAPSFYTRLTLGLWVGGELLGLLIGYGILGTWWPAYLCGIAFAAVGGFASWIVAGTCQPGAFRPDHDGLPPGAQKLVNPTVATISLDQEISDPPKPSRCYFLLGGAALLLAVSWIIQLPAVFSFFQGSLWPHDARALQTLLPALMLGGGLFLLLQPGRMNRIAGICAMVLEVLITSFFSVYLYYPQEWPLTYVLIDPEFVENLFFFGLPAILVAGVGLVFILLRPADQGSRRPAWIGAAVYLAAMIFTSRAFFLREGFFTADSLLYLIEMLPATVTLALAVFYCQSLTRLRKQRVQISAGARTWSILVIVTTCAAQILYLVFPLPEISVLALLLILLGVIGMILLTTNRRIGYLLALLGFGTMAMVHLNTMLVQGDVSRLGPMLSGPVNLSVLWGMIRGSWKGENNPAAQTSQGKRPASPLLIIGLFIGISIVMAILVGSVTYLVNGAV